MNRRFIVRWEAQQDLLAAQAYYEAARTGLGTRFVRAVKIKRLRDVVHYVLYSDRIEVVAVIHGSRDASAWQSRI